MCHSRSSQPSMLSQDFLTNTEEYINKVLDGAGRQYIRHHTSKSLQCAPERKMISRLPLQGWQLDKSCPDSLLEHTTTTMAKKSRRKRRKKNIRARQKKLFTIEFRARPIEAHGQAMWEMCVVLQGILYFFSPFLR